MNRWLLPEGIDELVSEQARAAETLRRQLIDLFDSWGYNLIIPPVIEFTDSLLTGLGADLDLKTIKVTDQVSGKMMGFRADISTQAARIDARMASDSANRFCYAGTVLHAKPELALSSRAPVQVGAELFGVEAPEADLEIILLMLQSLSLVTDQPLTLDIGHMGLYRWLQRICAEKQLPAEQLQNLIQAKRLPELMKLLDSLEIDNETEKRLMALSKLVGGLEVLEEAERVFAGVDDAQYAISELRSLAAQLSILAPNTALVFDLGEMRGSNYHTGIVFGLFAEHRGAPRRIANGGRYDEVGQAFGNARAATGFSADLKLLAQLITAEVDSRFSVYAPVSNSSEFWIQVKELREDGVRVILGYDKDGTDGSSLGCQQVLVFTEGQWQLQPIGPISR